MSSEGSEIGVVLGSAARLEKSYGRWLGAVLVWKALSVLRPRRSILVSVLSIFSAAAVVLWNRFTN